MIDIRNHATIKQKHGIANLTLSVKNTEEHTSTSVGGLINQHSVYEMVKPNWDKPCFALKTKQKPLAFVKEVKIPNQYLSVLPLTRVPWNLCTEPQRYESTEKLFEEIKECLFKYLETPKPEDLTIISAFIMLSWIIEKFETTPYLFFYGIFESGKSRALEMLHQLCFRAWLASDITPANLFRPIESWKPTLLLDESETFISRPEIIGLLNSGYKRGLIVPRQSQTPEGDYKTEWFDLFCPKAIAGTNDMARTTRSRCIVVPMQRATRKIPVFINKEECATIRNKLLQYRFNTMLSEASEASEPFVKEGYVEELTQKLTSGRLIELFLPLYAIAPDKYKKEILDYAQTINEERNLDLSTSEEVIILQAILLCFKEGLIQNKLILIKNINEKLNQETDFQEQYTNQKIGSIVSRIGFQKQHTNKGNCLIYNERLIKKLELNPRYKSAFQPTEIEDPSLKQGSQGSQPSLNPDYLSTAKEVLP
jgi:hypothetical protein